MSEKKHAWRLKRREVASQDDIRYLGPLSYRAFEILGWLCVVLSVAVVMLAIITSVSPKAGTGQSLPRRILPYATQASALFLVIAGISRVMRSSDEYRQQLLTYLGLAGIVALGTALIFQRTVMAAINRLFLDPKQVMPLVEKTFADFSGIDFIAFNVFIDIFLCILLFFFVNVRPKHLFTGKWTLFLRVCAVLPVAYAAVCMWLKYQAVCNHAVLHFGWFPLLTVKPVPGHLRQAQGDSVLPRWPEHQGVPGVPADAAEFAPLRHRARDCLRGHGHSGQPAAVLHCAIPAEAPCACGCRGAGVEPSGSQAHRLRRRFPHTADCGAVYAAIFL